MLATLITCNYVLTILIYCGTQAEPFSLDLNWI
jgi:hypothetical protein